VLIEFTADWCLTCKAVEKTVYARKDIQDLLKQKNVLVIKGDTTWEKNPATIALKEVYNEPGVPVTIIYVPGKAEPVRLHGLLIGTQLKEVLQGL
jgi:thiol:disulfide interchange protein DsbD